MASYVRYALSGSDTFATSWRLLRAAGAAGDDAAIDEWVKAQLRVEEPWMLREAAVDAAATRGFREAARPNLSDPYPRVRMRAASALSGDAASMVDRATLARKDTWPMVRAEAVESLRSEPDALPVVIAAVNDSMSVVRAAAIRVLTDAPHDEGWDRIHARLRAKNEWPIVTEAAIAYVVAHCRTDAAESLFRIVMRAAPSSALTEDLNNAARAIEALRQLGTPEANAVIERLRATPGVPPTLKMALDAPLPEDGGCANSEP
jgi:HEAT repeat protein